MEYLGEQKFPIDFLPIRNVSENSSKTLSSCWIKIREDFQLRFSKNSNKPPELINKIFAKKDDSFSKKLSKNASNGPDIDSFGVVVRVDEDLRCSVWPGRHVKGILVVHDFLLGKIHISNFEF